MRFSLLFSFCLICLSFSCNSSSEQEAASKENASTSSTKAGNSTTNPSAPKIGADPKSQEYQVGASKISIDEISQEDYDKAIDQSSYNLLFDKFCKESKGYQQDEWTGNNDCAFAIEKHLLENGAKQIERRGDQLILKCLNGKTKVFINSGETTKYRLKNFLEKSQLAVVEELKFGTCHKHHLINLDICRENEVAGVPAFANDESFFIATTPKTASTKHGCTNSLQYWMLPNGIPLKKWEVVPGMRVLHEIKFEDNNNFVAKKSNSHKDGLSYVRVTFLK